MKRYVKMSLIIPLGIVCGLLLFTALVAGCTITAPTTPLPVAQATPLNISTTLVPVATITTSTPVPRYTYSDRNVVAFTAASLIGVTPKLASYFEKMYPGHHVIFNLDGTQTLMTQVVNGAYADVFISASNTYTTELIKGGYFVEGTVKPLTSNYLIVILPANNPAHIQSLADLAKPGVKIAMGDKSVPVGTATYAAISNLAKSTYDPAWHASVMGNVVTYETTEPGVATKVALDEVDAGFVYESTYIAAPADTYKTIPIPKGDNYLQTYTIGVLKQSTSKGAAADFENFMLSTIGQQNLGDYGFRPNT